MAWSVRRSYIKYVCSDFLILDPPSRCTCTYAFSLHRMWFVREDVSERDKFCELLSIKEPQTTLQNKETTVQSCRKMLNKNAKKSPEIEGAIFKCTREMEMDNFGHLNSSLYLFCFFLLRTCEKKLWRTYSYSWTFPLTHTSQYAFSWIVPLLQAYLIYGWPLGTSS